MRIRKITVKNFRNLRDVTIHPHNPLILCGENNSGKSNLLHSLRLLFGTDANRLALQITEDDINEQALSEGEPWFTITVELGRLQDHKELEAIFKERLGEERGETFVSVKGEYRQGEDGDYAWKVTLQPTLGHESEPIQFNSRMTKAVPLYYLDAVRDADVELRSTGRGLLAEVLRRVELTDEADEIIQKISEANAALGSNASIKTISDDISSLLNSNMPGGLGKIYMGVATEDPSQILRGIRMSLQRKEDRRSFDISRHGTGAQNMILIAMFRYLLSEVKIGQPILAMEEPEAFLHVHAQRSLFHELSKIRTPIVITTHSPTLVSSADPLSLVRLKPGKLGAVTSHQLQAESLDANDRVLLARMMRSGRADALFARSIILVEGPCEVASIPAFAEFLGYDLDRDGISVLSADGNSFSYILNACNSSNFSIPSVVVFDADALDKNNLFLLREAFKSGLITKEVLDTGKKATAAEKSRILEDIGWIAAKSNFEEEVASAGYLEAIVEVIGQEGLSNHLERFLSEECKEKNPQGVSAFLKNRREGQKIKVPIAHKIASSVGLVKNVPACYANAIKRACEFAD